MKLIDFGIAKLATDGLVSTTTGAAIGTPAYMAPEQLQGLPAVPATDVHAVGACLFEMLAGRRPWRSTQSGAALAAEILRDEPLSLRELVPTLPPEVDAIVRRAMAKDPARRYPDASAMLADIAGEALRPTRVAAPALATRTIPNPYTQTLPATKTRRPWAVAIAVIAAALLGGTASFVFLRHPPPPIAPVSPPVARSLTSAELARLEEETWSSGSQLLSPQERVGSGPPTECWCAFDGDWPALCPTANPASCIAQPGTNGSACRGIAPDGIPRVGNFPPSGATHAGKLLCGKGRPPNSQSVGTPATRAANVRDMGL